LIKMCKNPAVSTTSRCVFSLIFLASTKAVVEESSKLAESVGKTRSLLKKILSEGMDNCLTKLDNDPEGYLSQPLTLLEAVLQECHNTFTACFHSFYPTPVLQWACLCDLLNCLDQVGDGGVRGVFLIGLKLVGVVFSLEICVLSHPNVSLVGATVSVVSRSVCQSGGWRFNPRPRRCVLEQDTAPCICV